MRGNKILHRSIHDKLDYLSRETGRSEAEIVAEAIETGLTELYRRQITNAYLSGRLDRKHAISELGEDAIEDLDYAQNAVKSDFLWGMNGE
jgi:predicted DNA-binding protein